MQKAQIREIEVKAKVANFGDVMKRLQSLGCKLSQPIKQEDTIYFPKGIGPEDFKKGVNALRIRKEGDKIILNIKQRQEVSLAAIEKEVEIADAKAMEEILFLLGFYTFIKMSKIRRSCHYKDYEICLDQINDLGNFIEVEKMSAEPGEKVQEELFQFLESLGIKREARATRGYDVLLYQKLHNSHLTR